MSPRTLATIALLLSMSPVAMAKKEASDAAETPAIEAHGDGVDGEKPAYEPLTFTPVGLSSVDDFFAKAGNLTGSIDSASNHLATARTGISSALALTEGTPIKDGLANLQQQAKGKLKLSLDKGGFPKIDAGKGTPANVKAALTGVNKAMGELPLAAAELVKVVPEAQQLIEEAKSIPKKIPKDAKAAGASLFKIPKMIGQTKKNITTLIKVPTVAKHLLDEVMGLVSDIKGAFAPAS